MIKLLATCMGCLLFCACNHNNLIHPAGVQSIKIVRYRNPSDSITITYNNEVRIYYIIHALNKSKPRPLNFVANCHLHLLYKDSSITVLANGTSMKMQGKTYVLDDSIEDILN